MLFAFECVEPLIVVSLHDVFNSAPQSAVHRSKNSYLTLIFQLKISYHFLKHF